MKNIIEILMNSYRETEEYSKNSVDMFRCPEIQTAQDTFVNPMFEKDFAAGNELDCILAGALVSSENCGFYHGFKCALKLAAECKLI